MKKYSYILKDLDCANCANKIQEAVAKNENFQEVNVNFSKMQLTFQTELEKPEKIVEKIIEKVEPEVTLVKKEEEEEHEETIMFPIIRLVIGALLGILAIFIPNPRLQNLVFVLSYGILLYRTAVTAGKKLWRGKIIDESFLITISCIGAFLVGEKLEGLMVIFLYEIGEILEDKAIDKSRKSIKKLMNIKPEYANRKIGETVETISPKDIKTGDIIVVKKGEKIPLDGIVIKGNSSLDTASLTGESIPQKVVEQDEVLSGSINLGNMLEIKVTKEYENSTVYKILELVENATDKKAKTETFVSKIAKIYTPIVILLAAILAIFLPILFQDISYSESIYRALTFLVISCPCAIAISVPLGYFSGIGKASKSGILIKGSQYLDQLKNVKEIIFDKTGTITTGGFQVYEVKSFDENIKEDAVLELVAKGESFSNHPIAKSIMQKVNQKIDTSDVVDYQEIEGKGISYSCKGKNIKIGNHTFVEKEVEKLEGTIIYLKIDHQICGRIMIKDAIKPDAKQTIQALKKKGIFCRMFTGDKQESAVSVAEEIGIEQVCYEMLPQDKYQKLEERLNKRKDEKDLVAFVGDGINDSPVLARADVGISMGGVGQESAIEASDVVIMTDNLGKIPEAIQIANRTIRIIRQNLIFAIGMKIVILIMSAFGIASMWHAVFADVGVTLITIFNTLRILK